ncbi:N-acetyltransferase [Prevotella sp. OH937_COT-195]|uniref:N-acetyltransferase n=1 Tax=Prevotella sp. OH937_COT-195 TaxID=2491051 RepID=UPI001F2F59C6|nr:N-acetyltransferase [Prevotella sp. OH937_COT-195]
MELIECGRQKMRAMGNVEQWTNGYPRQDVVMHDIENGDSYLVIEDGVAIATFAFVEGPDITYRKIFGGKWIDDTTPYHVIHRAASAPDVHGVMKEILDWCSQHTANIRIDTHRENTIMQSVLSKYGFRYCGIIYLLDGDERLAYQRVF